MTRGLAPKSISLEEAGAEQKMEMSQPHLRLPLDRRWGFMIHTAVVVIIKKTFTSETLKHEIELAEMATCQAATLVYLFQLQQKYV